MEGLDGCNYRSSSKLDDNKCFAAVSEFYANAIALNTYWATKVWSSGGTEAPAETQTNEEETSWVVEGVIKGLNAMYPDRFKDGVL